MRLARETHGTAAEDLGTAGGLALGAIVALLAAVGLAVAAVRMFKGMMA